MELTLAKCKKMMETNGGDLDLSYSNITGLPDGFVVEGNLNLRCSAISSLPDNLTVGGSLDLTGTQIQRLPLPENLVVGGWLLINNGTEIVAEINDFDGEIAICVQEEGIVIQDIRIARPTDDESAEEAVKCFV